MVPGSLEYEPTRSATASQMTGATMVLVPPVIPCPAMQSYSGPGRLHFEGAGGGTMLKLVVRALVVWSIEVVALLFLTWLLPGLSVVDLGGAIATIFVIGLLNAVIRPLLLLFAGGLGLIPFAIIALLLNAVILLLATRFVTGLTVDGLLTAFVASIGLAALNAILSGLLGINDEDSFYRNVVRKIAHRQLPEGGDLGTLGTVIIQIDGLAEPVLRRAIDE